MKNILALNGNPKVESFGKNLADQYEIAAKEIANVRRFDLYQMAFNPSLDCGYDDFQALEDSLVGFQEAVRWADHLLIVAPVWWGGVPAKLKGLFERTFLPGFAFRYETGNPFPIQLLKGKTYRLVLTMDAPAEYIEEQAQPVLEQLGKFTLDFSGIEAQTPIKFGSVSFAEKEELKAYLEKIKQIGKNVS